MSKLFGSVRSKLWIAAGCVVVLAIGVLTLPAPAPTSVPPPEERPAPLLEAEVERRQQLRIFDEVQQLGPRLARHSVTIPAAPPASPLPSDLMPRVPRVDPDGHGLIISADGEVLTSAGALRGREVLQIELFDGRRVEAYVVAFDPEADLVLLQSDAVPRTDAAPWATTPPRAGMLAVAVSHTGGQVAVAPVFIMAAPDAERRVRTTSADLLPGTPLYTTAGEVFAIAAGNRDASAALIAPAVSRLRERIAAGQARRGALGLTFQTLEGDLLELFPGPGVLVADVAPYGPAEEGGIQPGDVITAIGDSQLTDPDNARAIIAAIKPQSPVTIQVMRGGKALTIETTATSALGLRVRQTPREAEHDAPSARALLDTETLRQLELLPHSRIIAIDNVRVETVDEAQAVFRRGATRKAFALYVEDERGRFFRVLRRAQ